MMGTKKDKRKVILFLLLIAVFLSFRFFFSYQEMTQDLTIQKFDLTASRRALETPHLDIVLVLSGFIDY